jgi:flagellar assembly factor FliW
MTSTGQGTVTMQDGFTPEISGTRDHDIPVVTMVGPMLGFPEHGRFGLKRLDDEGAVCDLHSLDDPELRFVVVPPGLFFPDYAPEINEATAEDLQAESEEDLVALVVVTLGEGLADATANLLAPVLLNPNKRLAAQVVLDDASLPLRAPLIPDHAPES